MTVKKERATPANTAHIYTDGACKGNPGPGGWGYVILAPDGEEITNYGGADNVTNNQMELRAVIEALSDMEAGLHKNIVVHTDSEYVRKGITEWIHGWKKNGWKTAAKKPVKNAELWRVLDHVALQRTGTNIEWVWVKGHAGDKYNEMADGLANAGVSKVKF